MRSLSISSLFFFFNDTATTEIYTLSLHDALPIFASTARELALLGSVEQPSAPDPTQILRECVFGHLVPPLSFLDRKSTRLNSSHANISYAVFCLKKKQHLRPRTPPPPTQLRPHHS